MNDRRLFVASRQLAGLAALWMLAGCAGTPADPSPHPGILWVRTAAEFDALSLQAYEAAIDDLPRLVGDRSWSALPYQTDAGDLPPAAVFDVDETVVSNVEFQVALEPPFEDEKLDAWSRAHTAEPVAGVVEFAEAARAMGVTLFFVTNRPCMPPADDPQACPQRMTVTEEIREIGIPVEPEHVMLAYQQPGWSKEKRIRRDHIAETHRVVMLFGDDLGDFIPCTRRRPLAPCTEGATIESRRETTFEHRDYWGDGWYVLPNPMHGSWTTVR